MAWLPKPYFWIFKYRFNFIYYCNLTFKYYFTSHFPLHYYNLFPLILMKFPKHVILDVSHNSALNINKPSLERYDNLYKFTPFYSSTTISTNSANTVQQNSINNTNLNPLLSLCGLRLNSFHSFNKQHLSSNKVQITNSLNNSFNKSFLEVNDRIELKLQKNIGTLSENSTQTLFTIFFLRKEEIYTKLKYSRCPQYDMVSGGLAALFAAFLGFLICEKFGLELLDSGDFYIAFMYGVFATFSLRPLIRSMTKGALAYNVISPKHLFNYLFIIFNLLIKCWK